LSSHTIAVEIEDQGQTGFKILRRENDILTLIPIMLKAPILNLS
jgi:hypothetical protein